MKQGHILAEFAVLDRESCYFFSVIMALRGMRIQRSWFWFCNILFVEVIDCIMIFLKGSVAAGKITGKWFWRQY